jgi:predicted AAA+ superfamily ATPase
MITREAECELEELLFNGSSRNVVILEGARQVGKTALISKVLSGVPGSISVNLEIESILNSRINNTDTFEEFIEILRNEKQYQPGITPAVFIDEAQENEKLGAYVRQMKEKEGNTTRWILSGSSMTRLFREEHRIPVGRISRYKLNPFSFVDFLEAGKKDVLVEAIKLFPKNLSISAYAHGELLKLCDKYLSVGGLPEAVLAFYSGASYQEIIQQVFLAQEDDFVQKTFLQKRHLFQSALRGIANHIGTSSHYSHISDKTYEAKEIVRQLERWHLVNTIEQKGVSTTTAFHPKRYLYDIGICQLLRGHPFPSLSLISTIDKALRTPLGGLFENIVLLSLQGSSIAPIAFTCDQSKASGRSRVVS